MATEREARSKARGYLGGALVALGSAALLFNLATVGFQFQKAMESSGEQPFGTLPALGLAVLHMAQAFAFGQISVFSVVSPVLISFLAFLAVVAGFVLRRRGKPSRQYGPLALPCIY